MIGKVSLGEGTSIGSRYPKTRFSAQRTLICPRGTKGREQETEDKGEGDRNKGNVEGELFRVVVRGKGPFLDREETGVTDGQRISYKGKRGKPSKRMRCLILIGHWLGI